MLNSIEFCCCRRYIHSTCYWYRHLLLMLFKSKKNCWFFFYISYSFQISVEGISNQTTWDKLIQAKVMGAYLLFRIPLCIDCNLWQNTSHFHWKNLMTSIFGQFPIPIKIFHNNLTNGWKKMQFNKQQSDTKGLLIGSVTNSRKKCLQFKCIIGTIEMMVDIPFVLCSTVWCWVAIIIWL